MSRRRRIYLLLALLPTTLGIATLAIMATRPQTQAEGSWPAPVWEEAAPQVVLEQPTSLPASVPVEAAAGGGTPTVIQPEAPASEEKPASRPQAVEADEAAGPARYAGAGPVESNDSSTSWARGPVRLASLGAGGGSGRGGKGSSGSTDEDSESPQNPPGNEGSPGTGSEGGGGQNPPGSAGPDNPPGQGDTTKPEEPNQGGPNPGSGDEGGGDEGNGGNGGEGGGDGGGLPPLNPDPGGPAVQVPEPGTLGLFALGLLGCAARRKSRK